MLENSGGLSSGPGLTGGGVRAPRGRAPGPPPSRSLLDALPPGPPYYYGSYGQHSAAPCTNVEDLVAMWFAGSSSAGVSPITFIHTFVQKKNITRAIIFCPGPIFVSYI